MKKILLLIMAVAPTISIAGPADPVKYSECQYSVLVAEEAYLTGTFDTQRPDLKHLEYLVDFYADDLLIEIDRRLAKRSVRFLADSLKATGVRRPNVDLMFMPVRTALVNECARYLGDK